MTTGLPKLAECRDCHEPIRFVRVGQSALPVDPMPGDRGNVCARLVAGNLHGYVISKTHPWGPNYLRFMPHHATCSAITRKPEPPEDPALFPLPEEGTTR